MCKVLMPIKPEYAMQILEGSKTFEYRKNRFKRTNVDAIVIYVTSPVMKVLGEVELIDTLEGSPINIWKETSQSGGINKKSYDKYFEGRKKAVAYVLGKVKNFNINYYPQSYVYLD